MDKNQSQQDKYREKYPIRYPNNPYYPNPNHNPHQLPDQGQYNMPHQGHYSHRGGQYPSMSPGMQHPSHYPYMMPGMQMPYPGGDMQYPSMMPGMRYPSMMPNMHQPAMNGQNNMYMKNLFMRLQDKQVSLLIEGAKGSIECLKIKKVEGDVVIIETQDEVCVVPIEEITAVCMSKDIAEEIFGK